MSKGKIKAVKALVLLLLAGFAAYALCIAFCFPNIGSIHGVENHLITIDGVSYERDMASGFSSADRGRYLGSVSGGGMTMRVFKVKDDGSGAYLCALWEWEGSIYKAQQSSKQENGQ